MTRLLFPVLLFACSAPPPLPAPPPREPSRVGGTVKVSAAIRFKPKAVVLDPACAALVEGPLFQEERQVDKDGGAPGVIVYLKHGLEGRTFEAPKEKVLLQLKGHRFVPAVFGLRAGQELTIRNEEDHPYCVHALPFNNREFNVGLPKRGIEFTKRFDTVEVPIRIKDDCHPWMGAWVAVLPHPFFAVTDGAGRFEIPGLPPGKYTIEAWHSLYAPVTKEVEVGERGEVKADMEFTRRR